MPLETRQLIIELTARVDAQAARLDDHIDKVADAAGRNEKALRKLETQQGRANRQQREGSTSAQMLEKHYRRLGAAVLGLAGAYVGIRQAGRLFSGSIQEAAQFEQALVGVGKTSGLTGTALQDLGARVRSMATGDVPLGRDALLEIGQAAGQVGVQGVGNLERYISTMGKLGAASDLHGEEAVKKLTRILNVQGEGSENIERLASVLVRLGNNVAATEAEIAHIAGEVARATAEFKLGSTDVAGFAASLAELGVRAELGGSVTGRAMRKIRDAVLGGGEDLAKFARLTGLTGDQLRQVFARDATEAFSVFLAGLRGVIDSGGSTSLVLKDLGLGGEEVAKVLPTMASNLERFTEVLEMARKESRDMTALNEEAAQAFGTLEKDIARTRAQVEDFRLVVGEQLSPTVRAILDDFREWLKANEDLARSIGQDLATGARVSAEAVAFLAQNWELLVTVGLSWKALALANSVGGLTAALGLLGGALAPIAPAILAITATSAAVGTWISLWESDADRAIANMGEMATRLYSIRDATAAALATGTPRAITEAITQLEQDLRGAEAQAADAEETLASMRAELERLSSGGGAGATSLAIHNLTERIEQQTATAREAGGVVDEHRESLDRLRAKAAQLDKEFQSGLDKHVPKVTEKIDDLGDGSDDTARKLKVLSNEARALVAAFKAAASQSDVFFTTMGIPVIGQAVRDHNRALRQEIEEQIASNERLFRIVTEGAHDYDTLSAALREAEAKYGEINDETLRQTAALVEQREELDRVARAYSAMLKAASEDRVSFVGPFGTPVIASQGQIDAAKGGNEEVANDLDRRMQSVADDFVSTFVSGAIDGSLDIGDFLKRQLLSAAEQFIAEMLKAKSLDLFSGQGQGGGDSGVDASSLAAGASYASIFVAAAIAIWEIAEKGRAERLAEQYGTRLRFEGGRSTGSSNPRATINTAQAGLIAAELADQIRMVSEAYGIAAEHLGRLSIEIQNSGESFRVTVGEYVATFGSMEEATAAGLRELLQSTDLSNVGQNVAAAIANSTATSLESLVADLDLAQLLDDFSTGVTIAAADARSAVREITSRANEVIREAERLGLDMATAYAYATDLLVDEAARIESGIAAFLGGGARDYAGDLANLVGQMTALNDAQRAQSELYEERIEQLRRERRAMESALANGLNIGTGGGGFPGGSGRPRGIGRFEASDQGTTIIGKVADALNDELHPALIAIDDEIAALESGLVALADGFDEATIAALEASARVQVLGDLGTRISAYIQDERILAAVREAQIQEELAGMEALYQQAILLGAVTEESARIWRAAIDQIRAGFESGAFDPSGISRPSSTTDAGVSSRREARARFRQEMDEIRRLLEHGEVGEALEAAIGFNAGLERLAEEMQAAALPQAEQAARIAAERALEIRRYMSQFHDHLADGGLSDAARAAQQLAREMEDAIAARRELGGAGVDEDTATIQASFEQRFRDMAAAITSGNQAAIDYANGLTSVEISTREARKEYDDQVAALEAVAAASGGAVDVTADLERAQLAYAGTIQKIRDQILAGLQFDSTTAGLTDFQARWQDALDATQQAIDDWVTTFDGESIDLEAYYAGLDAIAANNDRILSDMVDQFRASLGSIIPTEGILARYAAITQALEDLAFLQEEGLINEQRVQNMRREAGLELGVALGAQLADMLERSGELQLAEELRHKLARVRWMLDLGQMRLQIELLKQQGLLLEHEIAFLEDMLNALPRELPELEQAATGAAAGLALVSTGLTDLAAELADLREDVADFVRDGERSGLGQYAREQLALQDRYDALTARVRDANLSFAEQEQLLGSLSGSFAAQMDAIRASASEALIDLVNSYRVTDPRLTQGQSRDVLQARYESLLARVRAGDLDARPELAQVAQQLMDANTAYGGTSATGFGLAQNQAIIDAISALPGVAEGLDPVVSAVGTSNNWLADIHAELYALRTGEDVMAAPVPTMMLQGTTAAPEAPPVLIPPRAPSLSQAQHHASFQPARRAPVLVRLAPEQAEDLRRTAQSAADTAKTSEKTQRSIAAMGKGSSQAAFLAAMMGGGNTAQEVVGRTRQLQR